MIQLQGPWPAPSITTLLPNPKFSDVESRDQTVDRKRTMNNTLYTYAKDTGVSRLTYSFILTRAKSEELQAFVDALLGEEILVTNHKNEQWLVTIANNPFEVQQSGSFRGPTGNEFDAVTLILEGTKQ